MYERVVIVSFCGDFYKTSLIAKRAKKHSLDDGKRFLRALINILNYAVEI